jgi:hypothetical protein
MGLKESINTVDQNKGIHNVYYKNAYSSESTANIPLADQIICRTQGSWSSIQSIGRIY